MQLASILHVKGAIAFPPDPLRLQRRQTPHDEKGSICQQLALDVI